MAARFLDPASIPLKRQSGGNIWATLVYITQGFIVVVGLAGLMLFFLPVINENHRHQDEKLALLRKIAAEQDQQQEYKLEIEHMKSDAAYVEHISRDQLNLGRPGETILHFDSYQPEPPPPKTAQPRPENDPETN